MEEKKKIFQIFRDFKKWWLTSMLITLVIASFIIIHVMKYNPAEFIYSLL